MCKPNDLRHLLAATCLLLGACGDSPQDRDLVPAVERTLRPLVLVTLDTTRADRIGTFGGLDALQRPATPNIDRFGRWGIAFDNAYAVAPITAVAHSSILTGWLPHQHGVRTNGLERLPSRAETLAERLRAEGYRTGAFVSAAVLDSQYGLDQGFEIYDDRLLPSTNRMRAVADRRAEDTVDAALEWLKGLDDDENFFLWVHLYDPHAPYAAPDSFAGTASVGPYEREIAYMDREIGRLMAHPRLRDQDTIATVLADHGESLGEHGEATHGILAFDATLRIPWILRLPEPRDLPDSSPPILRRGAEPVSQVDVVPTLLDALGLAVPRGLPGRSALRLSREEGPGSPARPIYAESYLPRNTYGWAELTTLLQPPMKLHVAGDPERAVPAVDPDGERALLFDLSTDPRELSDLSHDRSNLRHDLVRSLREFLAEHPAPFAPEPLVLDEESREQLRTLGYLSRSADPSDAEEAGERPAPWELVDLHADLERARTLLDQRLFEPAGGILEGVLERDPGNLNATLDLARSHFGRGDLGEAREVLRDALSEGSQDPQLLGLAAAIEVARGAGEEALALYREALRVSPGLATQRAAMAQLLVALEDRAAARALLDEGLELDPNQPVLVAAKARLITRDEDPRLAAQELRRALREGSEHALVALELARTLRTLGEWEAAIPPLQRAVRSGRGSTAVLSALHAELGELLALRREEASDDLRAAAAHLGEAARLSASVPSEWLLQQSTLIEELGEDGAQATAQRILRRVAETPADSSAAWNNRGLALYRLGRLDEAESAFERATETDDARAAADAWSNWASLALDLADFERAEEYCRRAIERTEQELEGEDPVDAQALLGLADTYGNLGIALDGQAKSAESIAAFETAHRLAPRHAAATLNLAIAVRKAGDPRRAAALLETLPRSWRNRAVVLAEWERLERSE